MSKFQIDIDFSKLDLANLETEEDFQKEAKGFLSQALIKLGENVGEQTWEELQKNLKATGTKVNSSASEKRKFIQETGRTYHRNASNVLKEELKDYIIEQLREYKRQGSI